MPMPGLIAMAAARARARQACSQFDERIVAILWPVVAAVRPRGRRLSGGLSAVVAARVDPPRLDLRVRDCTAGHAVSHDEPPGVAPAGGRPGPDCLFRKLPDRVPDRAR